MYGGTVYHGVYGGTQCTEGQCTTGVYGTVRQCTAGSVSTLPYGTVRYGIDQSG